MNEMVNRGNAGQGRQKGTPNKVTKELKDMILGALDDAGGQEYLKRQAEANPGAFLSLVGKCLPKEIKADVHSSSAQTLTDEELDAKIKEKLALLNE
jgi:hypothetical protein